MRSATPSVSNFFLVKVSFVIVYLFFFLYVSCRVWMLAHTHNILAPTSVQLFIVEYFFVFETIFFVAVLFF